MTDAPSTEPTAAPATAAATESTAETTAPQPAIDPAAPIPTIEEGAKAVDEVKPEPKTDEKAVPEVPTKPADDVAMTDFAMTDAAGSETPLPSQPATVASPAPHAASSPAPGARTTTPTPLRTTTNATTNGDSTAATAGTSSRAASTAPADKDHGAPAALPTEAAPHGAPVREYLNTHVTGAVLEGFKLLAKEKPKDPLRVLGKFLIDKAEAQAAGAANDEDAGTPMPVTGP